MSDEPPDILKRLDELPAPRAAANALTYVIYAAEESATGKVTMRQLEAAGAFA